MFISPLFPPTATDLYISEFFSNTYDATMVKKSAVSSSKEIN